jgi:hypothetical protein
MVEGANGGGSNQLDTWEWKTPTVPILAQQPQGGSRFVGESVSLSACAAGAGTLSYQWLFGSTNVIPRANQATLQFNSFQAAQDGAYSLVVSNAFGAVTSAVARVTLLPCQTASAGLVGCIMGCK